MKYLWVSSVFMAGLILSGGNVFAAGGNMQSDRAQNLSESRLLLADASLDLDITMEVVDEDVQSSKDITNVIELPVRSRYREMERHQEQLGNGPEFSDGPGEGQGHGPNPFLESRQPTNRPTDTGGRPGVGSEGAGNRGGASAGPADSGSQTNRPETPQGKQNMKGK